MHFEVITLFPDSFESFLASSLLGKTIEANHVQVSFTDPRDFAHDRHHKVDDTPYGGGAGMVMKAPPVAEAIEHAIAQRGPAHRVLLAPVGTPLDHNKVQELAAFPRLMLVCGRYEGIDDRVRELCIDETISVGDFVLSGGEVAAMTIIDAVSRLLPGVVGAVESVRDESFADGLLEHPHYTRPPDYRGASVPEVLLSGNHQEIRKWRTQQSIERTRAWRPELLATSPVTSWATRTYVALVHHPVYDKNGHVVTTAVTNLDIHDIARIARTYGLAGYFVVTPIAAQRQLVGRIIGHWTDGAGREHNDKRTAALSRVRLATDLADVHRQIMADARSSKSSKPYVVATSAQRRDGACSFGEMAQKWQSLADNVPILLLFGTGWGMCEEVVAAADDCLEPIVPIAKKSDYNHLSVRSAVAIICDRLFGNRE